MEFKIIAPGANELELVSGKPLNEIVRRLPGKVNDLHTKGKFGAMNFQHYAGEGFDIWFSNYLITEPTYFIGRGNESLLELHIQFVNQFTTNWDKTGDQILRPYSFNLSFNPFMNNVTTFSASKEVHTFDIHFSKTFLQRYATAFPLLDIFLEKVEKGIAADIVKENYLLNKYSVMLINDLLRKSFRPEVAAFYLDCKVRELLILILEQISGVHAHQPVNAENSIELMKEAKTILLSDYENRLTIPQLARKVGTNEFKLKKEFKQVFGMTIFECLQNERLEKARELLMEKELTVTEIAYMTGYDHVRNFSSAFKKKFGFSPSSVMKKK
jgi:AraC family transcriptional regulator, transcriptional activator of the genes for pyochelin and ferripyochelin receptors